MIVTTSMDYGKVRPDAYWGMRWISGHFDAMVEPRFQAWDAASLRFHHTGLDLMFVTFTRSA